MHRRPNAIVIMKWATKAKWFATTDDALLKRSRSDRERLAVEVVGPGDVPVAEMPDSGEPE
jgi:hypothetical protein